MKKKLLLILFMIVNNLYCQTDTIFYDSTSRVKFENDNINKLIDRYFILFNTGQDNSSISSFAGIDIGKTEVSFTPSFFDQKNNIWNLKFKGGITEGVSSVFKNNKFNTNINIEAQYNIRIKPSKIEYSFYMDDFNDYEKNLANQRITNLESLLKYLLTNKTAIDLIDKSVYDKTKAGIDALMAKSKDKIINNDTEGLNKSLMDDTKTFIDSLKAVVRIKPSLLKSLLLKEAEIGNVYSAKYKEEFKKLKLSATHQKWISISAKVRNDAFKLVNRANPYEEQITDKNYVSYGGSILFNNYRYSQNDNSQFYSVGIAYENKSNFLLLDDVDVNNTTQIGANGNSVREINEKYTAYEGDYVKYINQIDLVADYYYFFNSKSIFGVHAYEKSSFNKIMKPNYDAGAGIVFSFKNKDKENIINAELYYTFKDIASNNTEINAFESNEVGLRFVLPLNFNFNL
ncbi:hypothetical protein [Flavobacterium sp. JAS]|uniref:hypothetical protein n=1 Tax=Flavobacterium sp. JAS TaxID=2897329 RepID=UPI001E49FFB8|nr:hypothetical protein [Flavobacterium sp. JAS]MCD0472534.1 hypothetical protein [Flavobacterium sp. JAS]